MDARDKQHVVVDNVDGDFIPKPSGGQSRHRWTMLACIAPLSLIATALFLMGSAGIGSTVFLVGCVSVMSAMMVAMGRDRH